MPRASRTAKVSPRVGSLVVVPGLLVLMSPFAQLVYIPVSVGLGRALGLSVAEIGLTVGAHTFATAAGNLAFGPLLDMVPVRRVLPAALALNCLAGIALWWRQSYEWLLAGRVATGLASSVVVLCAYVLVSDAGRDDDRARDRGLSSMQTFQSLGAAAGLGLGALLAGLGRPDAVFLIMAVYAVGAALLAVAFLPHAPAPIAVGVSRMDTLRGVAGLVRHRRVLALMAASLVLGLVIQGSHFGVSALIEAQAPIATPMRVLLSMLIPLGVFSGSSLNRLLLRRRARLALYPRLYTGVPVAMAAFGLAAAAGAGLASTALALWLLGALLGAAMPLGVAIGVGWYPHLRASAASAEAVSRQVGMTIGPVVVGGVAATGGVGWAAGAVAAIAVVGAGAAWLAALSTDD
jgi:DHA1 family bicyclomycin/chloramphenicol resistance-like MFS transporter